MKSRLASFVMSVVVLLIVCAIVLLGVIIYQDISEIEAAVEPENFIGNYASNENTVDTETIKTPQVVENNPLNELQSGNSNTNVDYSSVSVDKYFYNQLEEPSKTIYKALESNKENMKTGTYRIDLGNSFTDILNTANGQDELGDYYQSAIEAYTYDNPDVFYLSPNKMYLNIETTTSSSGVSYNVYINNGNENNYFTDEFSNESQVESAISQIEQVKNSLVSRRTGNTYNDIKMVHDYLVDNIEYDTTISKDNIYDIYGALVNHVAVCEGYARSFKYILDEMGIPCVLVIGTGTNSRGETERHAWNYVELQGSWYAVDCTWDDPVVVGGGTVSQSSKYKYFLKGSNEFYSDHSPSGQFTPGGKEFSYPSLSSSSFSS